MAHQQTWASFSNEPIPYRCDLDDMIEYADSEEADFRCYEQNPAKMTLQSLLNALNVVCLDIDLLTDEKARLNSPFGFDISERAEAEYAAVRHELHRAERRRTALAAELKTRPGSGMHPLDTLADESEIPF